jgi:hypothetical protein
LANRVTASELRSVITVAGETDPVTDQVLDLFISDANLLVNEYLAVLSPPPNSARLKLIEKYLAAHLYVLTSEQGGLVKEEVGDASRTYNLLTKTEGLNSTRFGKQVMFFDTSGKLAGLGSGKPPARFQVV